MDTSLPWMKQQSKLEWICQSLCCKHIINRWSVIRTSCNEFERKTSRDREIERRSIWEIFAVFCCVPSWMINHVLYILVVRNILLTNPITNLASSAEFFFYFWARSFSSSCCCWEGVFQHPLNLRMLRQHAKLVQKCPMLLWGEYFG